MANQKPEAENKINQKQDVSIKSARKAERAAQKAAKHADRAVVDIRNTKLKRFSAMSIVLAILVVVILNLFLETAIGDKLSFDFTSNKLMTLGEVSEELLSNLDQDVRVVVLNDEETFGNSHSFMPELLKDYVDKSKGHVKVEYINPVNVPTIYDELDPNDVHSLAAGQVVVKNEGNERLRTLTSADFYSTQYNSNYQQVLTGYKAEASLSGAINYVTMDLVPTIYLTTGHSEVALEQEFTTLESLLKYNGFEVKEIDLSTSGNVPEDASVVVMLAPQNDLTAPEAEKLLAYLRTGGGFLFAAGPFSTTPMTNVNKVLSDYNMQLMNDRVRENDTDRYFIDTPTTMSVNAPANEISAQLVDGRTMIKDSYYVQALSNTLDWVTVSTLLETTETGSRELNGLEENQSPEGVQTVGLMTQNDGFMDGKDVTKPTRVVALGSASLFADSTFEQIGFQSWYNYSLTYNMLSWLSNNEANAGSLLIRDKEVVSYNLTDVTSTRPLQWSALFATVLIPAALFIAAIVVYRRRKHL